MRREKGWKIHRGRKYHFNFDYFRQPIDEHRAYWLGFIRAEGHIALPQKNLRIELRDIDKPHIEKMRQDLEGNMPIRLRKKLPNNSNYIDFSSRYFIKSLLPFPNVPIKMKRHFWRGMIDGDGSIFKRIISPQKFYTWFLSFSGSLDDVTQFREFIKTSVKIDNRRISYSSIAIGGNRQVPKAVSILYKNSTIYLDRKYKLYEEIKNTLHRYWADRLKIDRCKICGTTKRRHRAHGLCRNCYERLQSKKRRQNGR